MRAPVSVEPRGQGEAACTREPPVGDYAQRRIGVWLLPLTVVNVALTAFASSQARHPAFSPARVAVWWGASLLLLLLTAAWRDLASGHPVAQVRPSVSTILAWSTMAAIAALPRLAMLDRYPTVLDADEGAFIAHAVEFQQGHMPNPFGTGFFSTPLLYLSAQGILAGHAMDGISEYRLLSALLGTVGVLATWRLGRRIVGPTAGLLAGVFLAGWPLHLYFSARRSTTSWTRRSSSWRCCSCCAAWRRGARSTRSWQGCRWRGRSTGTTADGRCGPSCSQASSRW